MVDIKFVNCLKNFTVLKLYMLYVRESQEFFPFLNRANAVRKI